MNKAQQCNRQREKSIPMNWKENYIHRWYDSIPKQAKTINHKLTQTVREFSKTYKNQVSTNI